MAPSIFRQIPRGNVIFAGYPRTAADPRAQPRSGAAGQDAERHAQSHDDRPDAGAMAHVIRVWSGIEGYLPDMLPVIGASETTPGLFHAFGFCGHGFQVGPGVGLCLSEMILDGETPTPLDPFSIMRFRKAPTVSEKFRKEFD